MTPAEIIDRAKLKFDVLYHSNPAKLLAMMQDTLGVFEDKAGAIRSAQIVSPETSIEKPADMLAVCCVHDGKGMFVESTTTATDIVISGIVAYPVTVKYLVNFRDMEPDVDLPAESVGLIQAHFTAQLTARNTRRERAVATAAGLQVELPSEESLTAKVETIETSMEETAAIIPMITVV